MGEAERQPGLSRWDAKYAAAPEGLFGSDPGEYLRQVAARSDFSARSGLCLADGDGRNSRWLAQRGLAMTAVDLSAVAVENGRTLDRSAGVTVERIVADLETWSPVAERRFDFVVLFYLQAPWSVRGAALRAGWRAVAAGGLIVVEGFAKTAAAGALGPEGSDLRYSLEEITAAAEGVEIVEALSGQVRLDEGSRHQGLADVVRFIGRKPLG